MDGVNDYLEASEFQTRDAAEIIEEFADEITEMRGRCIDIGCGPGTVTRELFLPRLPFETNVVGMDVSKKMIDFAKKEHADENRLSFVDFDIETEELPPSQIKAYDSAVSFYCLHWCKSPGKACENIFHLLQPGGRALLMFLARYDALDSNLEMREKPRYKPYMEDVMNFIPYFQSSNCPREKFKKMLQDSGFKVIHCSVREKSYTFKNLSVLKKHAWATNPFVYRMPENMREQFITELAEDSLKRSILVNNSVNGSKDEYSILNKYSLIIAYFKKPIS